MSIDSPSPALQLLVEQIQDFAIFLISPDGRNASWNPGVERVLGFTEEEFLGESMARVFTPEDRARGVPEAELAVASDSGAANDDRWMLRRDGSRFWASGITTSLRDDAGELLGYGKVLRDLTHERLLQERLQESEDRLRLALTAARVGTWRWDLRTGADTLDANLATLLGLGTADMVVTLDEFFAAIHPDDRERTRSAFDDAVRSRVPLEVEFRVIRGDGSVRWLRDYGETILDGEGEPRYLTGAVVDITDQRDNEDRVRQSHRLDAVGKLAGGVAHEVNNMMSVVLGFTEFLAADFPPGDRRARDLEQVRMAAGRAAAVTAQLLAFSRRQMLQPTVLDLGELVAAMAPVLGRLLGEDKELVIRRAPAVSAVKADQGQLEQVIINLALNARDAMRQGDRLTVEVADAPLDAAFAAKHPEMRVVPGNYVMLAVTDTGHGMDRDTLGRVFEPFFTTKPTGQGSGLGLAVVHGTVHQSGGHIVADSAPGAGASFRIYLPSVAAAGHRPPAVGRAAAADGGGETILVVEDEPMVRRLAVRMLERLGYAALEAGDGVAALELLGTAKDVALVVADLVMPRMSGRELGEHIARLRPGLPVLYMSGYTDDEMIRRNLLEPDAPFIQKPFAAAVFAAKLRGLLPAR
jgi:PAS domain S-box-containing protein